MPINIPKNQGGDFKLPPADTHVARCIGFVDLGTQEESFKGKDKKEVRKCRITWELPNELEVFNEEKGKQPFIVSKEYIFYFSPKSIFRRELEAWRGQKFEDHELNVFDERKIVGTACMVTITHNVSANGKTYANVSTVTKLLKGTVVPNQINPSVIYLTTDGDNDVFQSLPDFLKEKIKKSPEFKGATDQIEDGNLSKGSFDPDADDIPF